jgi:hypothetical protein
VGRGDLGDARDLGRMCLRRLVQPGLQLVPLGRVLLQGLLGLLAQLGELALEL